MLAYVCLGDSFESSCHARKNNHGNIKAYFVDPFNSQQHVERTLWLRSPSFLRSWLYNRCTVNHELPLKDSFTVSKFHLRKSMGWPNGGRSHFFAVDTPSTPAEIVDIRSMMPLDIDTIAASVSKTGRCLIAHEATRFAGFGAELSASIQERCFWDLEAPIMRVAGWDTPYPHAFEWEYFPGKRRVVNALKQLMAEAT